MDPPDGATPVVQFEEVSITFDVKPVLRNISFSVERGQTLVLLGPAGCGKSVLLKLANGLLKPDSGTIRVFGEDIDKLRRREMYALRARIGMVFQESALFDSLNVEENVAYRLHEEHVPEAEAHARVVEALKFVELEAAIDKFPLRAFGRDAPPRLHCARHHQQPRPDPLRLAHRRARPHHLDHHHRAGDEAARRLAYHLAGGDAPAAGRVHACNPPLRSATGGMKPLPKDGPDHGIDEGMKFLLLNEGKIVFHGTTEELVHSGDPWVKRYLE